MNAIDDECTALERRRKKLVDGCGEVVYISG